MSDILCVTNRKLCGGDFFLQIEKIAEARPKGIILREKDLTESEYLKIAEKTIGICEKYGTDCILHMFINAAKELGKKKIHLPLGVFRKMTNEDRDFFEVIGVSCHSEEDAEKAEKSGASYITAGHIFETDCKKGLSGRGLGFLENVCKSVGIPVYAIGGISPDNINEIIDSGAAGACIMSGIMNCGNPKEYLLKFKERTNGF